MLRLSCSLQFGETFLDSKLKKFLQCWSYWSYWSYWTRFSIQSWKNFSLLGFCLIHISCWYVMTYANIMVSQALQVCRGDSGTTLVRLWYDSGTTGHDSRFKVEKIFAISCWFSIGLMLVIYTSCWYVRVYVYILFPELHPAEGCSVLCGCVLDCYGWRNMLKFGLWIVDI